MSRCQCRGQSQGQCRGQQFDASPEKKKRGGVFRLIANVAFLYLLLVFGGGTLINTGHPVAEELGRIMHLITFVEPSIYWAEIQDYDSLSDGLRVLSTGFPIAS